MIDRRLYLDYNATTPLLASARRALVQALDMFGNPSSVHEQGRAAKALLQRARRDVAALVGADKDWVVFTSGATEAAATLLTTDYMMGRSKLLMSHLYLGATEHPCVLAGGRFPPEKKIIIPVLTNGLIDLVAFETLLHRHDLSQGLPLVAIQYANHETGIIQPVAEIGTMVKKAGGLLIVDAVQAIGKETVRIAETGADFLIISAHKMGGAKGVGAFIASGSLVMPQPFLTGGGQERGHRSGTEALPLIAAFGAAAVHIASDQEENQRLLDLRQRLEMGLKEIAPEVIIYGENVKRLSNTCFFSIQGMKAETLAIALDLEGVAVSNGSACSSGKVGTSAVLKAMGSTSAEGAIRLSIGHATQSDDVADFLRILQKILVRSR